MDMLVGYFSWFVYILYFLNLRVQNLTFEYALLLIWQGNVYKLPGWSSIGHLGSS